MEFSGNIWAYEIDDFGNGDSSWATYTDDHEFLARISSEIFGDFLDRARGFGYDVIINTYKSWEALDNA